MRQDQEALVGESRQDTRGDLLGVSTPSTAALRRPAPAGGRRRGRADLAAARGQQVGAHGLGAQAGHGDALVPVGDRQPFGERDQRVLGHRVRRGAELGQQAGGRRGEQQVSLAAGQHPRQHRPRRVDVAVHVDVPHPRPGLVRHVDAAAHDDAGVGAEQVDPPERVLRPVDEGLGVGRPGQVRGHRQGPVAVGLELRRDLCRARPVEIGDDDRFGAPPGEGQAERAADAARAP